MLTALNKNIARKVFDVKDVYRLKRMSLGLRNLKEDIKMMEVMINETINRQMKVNYYHKWTSVLQ